VIEEEFEESPSPFYLEINLTNVLVVRFDLSVDAGSHGTEFKETWDLNYSKIKFSYLMRGQQQGTTDMEFDRPLNSGATASKKAPLTAAEEADRKKKEFDDYMKTQAKKTGK
jgi:hypothetical protein